MVRLLSFAMAGLLLSYFAIVQVLGSVESSSIDLGAQASLLAQSSLQWVQRPNLYFGMRARTQGDSPLFGLMWFGTHDYAGYQSELV